MATWQADGWDARVRIGVLVPHGDLGPESELSAMAPRGVAIHATRVPFGAIASGGKMNPTIPLAPVRAFADPPFVDDATELLAAAPIDVIAFGFTSSAYVIGPEAEAAMITRLQSRSRGLPVVTPCAASAEALRALGCRRIALMDPPWFDAELSNLGRQYYESAGFAVVYAEPCGLPSDQKAITPENLHTWAVSHTPDEAEGLVIGGNGFRAVGTIERLEADLRRPVLTANQVLMWAALRAAKADSRQVTGYGRVFATPGR